VIKETLPILLISCMVMSAIFMVALPKHDHRHFKATGVLAFCGAILVASWLLRNPSELASIETEIVVALISFLVGFLGKMK
jgi:hypothetical protein